LADPDVPPEVGVLYRPDEEGGDDDHHAAHEKRARAQPLGECGQLRDLSGLGT